jgi:hypothetical protein
MGERGNLRGWLKRLAGGALLLAGAFGCKLPPPNLKPPEGPQELNKPPQSARFDSAVWPDKAVADDSPNRPSPFAKDDKGLPASTSAPAPGGFGSGGMPR